jgi:hypothetical protein
MVANANQVISLGIRVKTSTFDAVANIAIEALLPQYFVQNKTVNSTVFDYQCAHEINYRRGRLFFWIL